MEISPGTQLQSYAVPRGEFSIRDNYFGRSDTYGPQQTPIAFNTFLAGANGAGASALNRELVGNIHEMLYDNQKDFCQLQYDMNSHGHVRHLQIATDRYNRENGTFDDIVADLTRAFPGQLDFGYTMDSPFLHRYRGLFPPFINIILGDEINLSGQMISTTLAKEVIQWIISRYERGPIVDDVDQNRRLASMMLNPDPTDPYWNSFKWYTMNFLAPVYDLVRRDEGDESPYFYKRIARRTTREYADDQRDRLFDIEGRGRPTSLVDGAEGTLRRRRRRRT